MPTLDWIGKKAVVNHHREVPFHLLKEVPELSCGDPNSGNLIVEGDNLLALKALLPYYAGKVKCIYIDPPYNTGNEGWVYNDNVNSPEMRDWLGRTVGKEAEDLSRHDKWLCMMYPRLALLKDFLNDSGAIFVSIDDNEVSRLRSLLDEIFGPKNFVATVIWQKVFAPKNSAIHLSEDHDYVIIYAKVASSWRPNLLPRSESANSRYKNPDKDPRGPWTSGDIQARNFYSEGTYPIKCPSGRIIPGPGSGMYWRVSKSKFQELDADGRIWWGPKGNNMPRLKRFLSEVKDGVTPQTLWLHKDVGHTQEAKKELLQFIDFESSEDVFITPKPTRLVDRILAMASDGDSLILDSFAGSGSTGHSVLKQNAGNKENRKFILVEIDPRIAESVTAARLRNVVKGRKSRNGESIPGVGGGFKYVRLAEHVYDEAGRINEAVKFPDLARHVFFTETGTPLPADASLDSPLIGSVNDRAVYLLFNGILKDKSADGGNRLTRKVLQELPPFEGSKVVYGTACQLGQELLQRHQVTFKQIPYAIPTH